MGKENLNPFSSKGCLGFGSFCLSLIAVVTLNLIIYAFIRGALIPARTIFDKEKVAILYVTWFLFASIGFSLVANAFIKRWSDILGESDVGRPLKALIRFSLLSPLLGLPMTVLTLLFFPRSLMNDVENGGSKRGIVAFMIAGLGISIGASTLLPRAIFGLERIGFRESTNAFISDQFNSGKNPFPSKALTRPILSVATPALRYFAWLASDVVRTRMLSIAIEHEPAKLCAQRLGFIKVEVQDCYFNQLRKMALEVPMVAPYFALYFESEYRKKANESQAQRADQAPVARFATSLLMISNLLELLEPGPMFVERAHFLKPSFLLHAYGSPEVALVEAGQDLQRVTIVEKLLPMFDAQIEVIQNMLNEFGPTLGPDAISVKAELREILIRIQAVRKDPLMLGTFAR